MFECPVHTATNDQGWRLCVLCYVWMCCVCIVLCVHVYVRVRIG